MITEEEFSALEEAGAFVTCRHCGTRFEEDDTRSFGNCACEDCFDRLYASCDECYDTTLVDDLVEVRASYGKTYLMCPYCIDHADVHLCSECGEYHTDSFHFGDNSWVGISVCMNCADDFAFCECCGTLLSTNDMSYSDSQDAWYCSDCYRVSSENYTHEYFYKPHACFHGDGDEMFMGVELETDAYSDTDPSGYCDSLTTIDRREQLFYLKHDSSLDGLDWREDSDVGVEIVTHPCTLDYHLNQFPWNKICNTINRYGYSSDNDNCGMHIHVSRDALGENFQKQEETVAKLLLIMDRFFDDRFTPLSRRRMRELERWANKPNADILPGDTNEIAVEKMRETQYTRYRAINIENDNTVEFRLWKGTQCPEIIKALLQLTGKLCLYAKATDISKCMTDTWDDIMSFGQQYEELNAYMKEIFDECA